VNDDARDGPTAALFLLRLGLEQVVEHAFSLTLDEKPEVTRGILAGRVITGMEKRLRNGEAGITIR
jgi:hypothetical protein